MESNVCNLGISTILAVVSATRGDDLREVLGQGVEKWLHGIVVHTKTLDEHFVLLRKVLKLLQDGGYTCHFYKSEFLLPEIESLGVMVGRDGIRPAPSKIKAVQELKMPTTVEEVRAFLGLAGHLRGFIPNLSDVATPISDIFRSKEFAAYRGRQSKRRRLDILSRSSPSIRSRSSLIGTSRLLYTRTRAP